MYIISVERITITKEKKMSKESKAIKGLEVFCILMVVVSVVLLCFSLAFGDYGLVFANLYNIVAYLILCWYGRWCRVAMEQQC